MEPGELLFDQDEKAATVQPTEAPALPLAAARRVYVRKQAVLEHALQSLSLKMHGAVACVVGNDQILGSVSIDVPPHGQYPFLHERTFYGDYELTEDAALESANLAALLYLQKSGIIIVDDINLSELASYEAKLADCQRKLLAASSWATMFVERSESLQAKLTVANKANEQLLQAAKALGVKEEASTQEPSGVKAEASTHHSSAIRKNMPTETACHSLASTDSSHGKKQCTLPATSVRRSLFQTNSTDDLKTQNYTGGKDRT